MTDNSIRRTTEVRTTDSFSRISRQVRDMCGMLRAQRELLAQRGLQLPTEPLDGLTQLAEDLEKLAPEYQKADTELEQLRELARTTKVTTSGLALDSVLSDVIDTVIVLTRAERGYIVLKHPQSGALEFKIARNMQQTDLADEDFIVSRTVVQRVADEGNPVVTTNAQEDPRFAGSLSIAGYMLRSILCVPLKLKGQVTGVIYADNRLHQGIFGDQEEALVSAFANQAAIAIENARLIEQLRATLAEVTSIRDFMDNIFSSIASGVVAANQQDTITALNRAASHILDLRDEAAVGKALWNVLPPLYDGFDRLIEEVRDQGRKQSVEVEPVLDRRGQVTLNLKLSPLRDTQQVTQGVAIVLDDLTAEKQQQAQIGVLRRYLSPAMFDNIQTIDELELGGVERPISVFYCDVRGFSTFSEQVPPEDVMQVVNQYLALSTAAIDAYEGVVDKYMGDAVVGLFNTQLNPQEDHARRAVMTALRVAEGVRALHASLPPSQRLFYGIGVHTGLAILGNVGSPSRKEFTAIGETLRLAKLLQENAASGEIMLSEQIYHLVRDEVKAVPLPPRKLKDQPDFTVMYQVQG